MSGYYGASYDRHLEHGTNTSALGQLQEKYWTAKQQVIRKLNRKEDEHVVAADQELDSKLDLFHSVKLTSCQMMRTIEKYQVQICELSQEENSMGRFLKDQSKIDKTRAGKMMAAVGKTQSFSSQQRLALRVPLVRLYQEVETFRYRAIADTMITVNKMEAARTEYRGALLWMQDISKELDPDTYRQLEKFRKVQMKVRSAKKQFDRLKVDCMQKIDLLAASRCNMFSHVLANYQSTLLHFWEKTSKNMAAVVESFKGYQYYEFNMLKELAEPSKRLAEQTSKQEILREEAERDTDSAAGDIGQDNASHSARSLIEIDNEVENREDDILEKLFGEEINESDTQLAIDQAMKENEERRKEKEKAKKKKSGKGFEPSVDLETSHDRLTEGFDFTANLGNKQKTKEKSAPADLLSAEFDADNFDDDPGDDMTLLNEILNAPSADNEFSNEWSSVFGNNQVAGTSSYTPVETDTPKPQAPKFMPSQLLSDLPAQMQGMHFGQALQTGRPSQGPASSGLQHTGPPTGAAAVAREKSPTPTKPNTKKGAKSDMSAWFSLFADLDPLANPDAVGRTEQGYDDRNC